MYGTVSKEDVFLRTDDCETEGVVYLNDPRESQMKFSKGFKFFTLVCVFAFAGLVAYAGSTQLKKSNFMAASNFQKVSSTSSENLSPPNHKMKATKKISNPAGKTALEAGVAPVPGHKASSRASSTKKGKKESHGSMKSDAKLRKNSLNKSQLTAEDVLPSPGTAPILTIPPTPKASPAKPVIDPSQRSLSPAGSTPVVTPVATPVITPVAAPVATPVALTYFPTPKASPANPYSLSKGQKHTKTAKKNTADSKSSGEINQTKKQQKQTVRNAHAN